MSETAPATDTQQTPEPKSELSELARKLDQLIERDRNPAYELGELPLRRTAPKREPFISPRVSKAINQSLALWPLFVLNAFLLWVVLVVFHDAESVRYIERVARILQLATIALLFDVWLHPLQHPETLEGPAQGARQYQRIYLIGIFVIAGCIAL